MVVHDLVVVGEAVTEGLALDQIRDVLHPHHIAVAETHEVQSDQARYFLLFNPESVTVRMVAEAIETIAQHCRIGIGPTTLEIRNYHAGSILAAEAAE